MDHLYELFGAPPLKCDQIFGLHRQAISLTKALESGKSIPPREVIPMIDMLQALLNIATAGYLYDIFPELESSDASHKSQRPRLPPAFEDLLKDLPFDLLVLRDQFFGSLMLPPLCKPHPQGATLCHHCNWVLERIGDKPSYLKANFKDGHIPKFLLELDSWPDFPELDHRANSGCEFCAFVRKTVQSFDVEPAQFINRPSFVSLNFIWRNDRLSGLAIILDSTIDVSAASTGHSREFYIEAVDEIMASKLPIDRPRHLDPLDSANITMLKSRLSLDSAAPSGRSQNSLSFVPKRLIDVGNSQNSCPRLVSLNSSRNVGYATLSYCWGPSQDAAKQMVTTPQNLAKHETALPEDEMPAVTRDAIVVCRALGIRYVWIDALCIVQGSGGDWETQSAQMSEIFGNSILTICAAASTSCLEGFIEKRESPAIQLGFRWRGENPGKALYSLRPRPYEHGNVERYSLEGSAPLIQDLAWSKWTQRGWVYQERCLSTKKLYFGKNMIHVQVGDEIVSENGNREDVGKQDSRSHRDWPKDVTMEYLEKHEHLKDYWYELVEQVALLQWTKRQDLFPSISGLASRFHNLIQSPYIAGLWTEDLHCGLLWEPGDPPPLTFKAEPGRPNTLKQLLDELKDIAAQLAPSWSWASRKLGRCQFVISAQTTLRCRVRTHLRPEFKLLESRVKADSASNPFGALRCPASLLVRGKVIAPRIKIVEVGRGRGNLVSLGGSGTSIANIFVDWGVRGGKSAEIDVETQSRLQMLLVSSCCADSVSGGEKAHDTAAGVPAILATDSLEERIRDVYKPQYTETFLQDKHLSVEAVRSTCGRCGDDTAPRDVWGLLIHPASDVQGTNRYYRVGLFISRANQGGMELFQGAEERTTELM